MTTPSSVVNCCLSTITKSRLASECIIFGVIDTLCRTWQLGLLPRPARDTHKLPSSHILPHYRDSSPSTEQYLLATTDGLLGTVL